jgi:hypothetical protein
VTVNVCVRGVTETSTPTEVQDLLSHFSQIEPAAVIERRSRAFQDLIQSFIPSIGFERILNAPINPNVSSDHRANYRVDLALQNKVKQTSIPVELAFNNRESIGTNLLKLESFRGDAEGNLKTPFGIIVAPTSSLLNFGGWDSSYGDSLEYEDLRLRVHADSLSLPLYIIELHGIF